MAVLDIIKPSVKAVRLIASIAPDMKQQLKLPAHMNSVGLLTADSDDVTYIAADEATKQAQVDVVYGRSLYAGAAHSSSPTAGEVIIMLGGPSPAEVQAGLDAMIATIEDGPAFRWADEAQTTAFLAKPAAHLSLVIGPEHAVVTVEQSQAIVVAGDEQGHACVTLCFRPDVAQAA